MERTADKIILRPWITERSSLGAERGVYCFQVAKFANKPDVTRAVKEIFHVTPTLVRVLNVHGKKVSRNRKIGRRASVKKAYVTLKIGEKIEFV